MILKFLIVRINSNMYIKRNMFDTTCTRYTLSLTYYFFYCQILDSCGIFLIKMEVFYDTPTLLQITSHSYQKTPTPAIFGVTPFHFANPKTMVSIVLYWIHVGILQI